MKFVSLMWWREVYAKGGRAFALGCALVFILPIVISAGFTFSQRRNAQPEMEAGTIATVNGDPITLRDLAFLPDLKLTETPGEQHVQSYGGAILLLVEDQVVLQMAKKQNVQPSDADVDKQVASDRARYVGPNATDDEWNQYLDNKQMSSDDFRQHAEHEATGKALLDHYAAAEKVSTDDAHSEYSEVKLAAVYIKTLSPSSSFPGSPKSLPDAEALKKANDLHAKAAAGGDIIAMAKENADPFGTAKSTGISDWQKEHNSQIEAQIGSSLMFGKDVDEAVRKTPKGKITDVVKAIGFQPGYFFAKVIDRRENLPKGFEVNKEIAQLKLERARKKLIDDLQNATKIAKVVFAKGQVEYKADYDYAKYDQMSRENSASMMGGGAPDAPTPQQMAAQKTLYEADFEAELKAHPDDATANLMVASALQGKLMTASPTEAPVLRDRLIKLYETAFKASEDKDLRITLAGLYHDKHDYKNAYAQYAKVDKLLNDDPPYDLKMRQAELNVRNRLVSGLNGIPAAEVPDSAALVAQENKKVTDLTNRIKLDQEKEEADRKAQAEQQKKDADAAALKAKQDKNKPTTPSTAGGPAGANTAGGPATAGSGGPSTAPSTAAPGSGAAPPKSAAAGSTPAPGGTGSKPAAPTGTAGGR